MMNQNENIFLNEIFNFVCNTSTLTRLPIYLFLFMVILEKYVLFIKLSDEMKKRYQTSSNENYSYLRNQYNSPFFLNLLLKSHKISYFEFIHHYVNNYFEKKKNKLEKIQKRLYIIKNIYL
jgi:hypothetical protein